MYKTEQLLDDETKDKDYTVVMGDFNAVVGEGKEDVYVGHYGLAYCNDNGQMLADFCKKRQDVQLYMYTATTSGQKTSIHVAETWSHRKVSDRLHNTY